jgi:hypothetical protein
MPGKMKQSWHDKKLTFEPEQPSHDCRLFGLSGSTLGQCWRKLFLMGLVSSRLSVLLWRGTCSMLNFRILSSGILTLELLKRGEILIQVITIRKEFNFTWQRQKIFDKFISCILYKHMMRNGGKGRITEVTRSEKLRYKPYPLTTIAFQKLAVKKLRMSSEKAMKIAESLYQKGIISYPRTETNVFPYTMNLKNILSNISDQPYEDYIRKNKKKP